MNKRNKLFEIICSDILSEADSFLAKFVYDIICEENFDGLENSQNTSSESSFEETVEHFERVLNLFDQKTSALDSFLLNYRNLSVVFKKNNRLLKEYAKPVQTTSTSSDIATISSIVAGGALCLSFNQLLFPVVAPVAVVGGITSAIGGGFATTNTLMELRQVKKMLKEAKLLTKEELEAFSAMSNWFTYLEELKKSIEILIDYDVLKQMFNDLMKFFDRIKYQTNIKVGEYKDILKETLKLSLKRMMQDGKLKFENEITPVALTFIFVVCLMQEKNRIVWECIMKAQGLKFDPMSWSSVCALASHPFPEEDDEAGNFVVVQKPTVQVDDQKNILNLDNANNLLSVEPSIESCVKGWLDITDKIKSASEEFERAFFVIEHIFFMLQQYESIANNDVTPLTTIIVSSVPDEAKEEDIKMGVKLHIPEEAWDSIRLQKLSTSGNNWLVQVPPLHSQQLYQQTALAIKNQLCTVMH